MKYIKKPVVIEAFKYEGDFVNTYGVFFAPDWIKKALDEKILFFRGQAELFIKTLEGEMHVSVGDYIIQGVKGELYPCKPDIFESTYMEAE